MKNYSKKLIYDYIIGNDIEGYNIDDLEDNIDFMTEVIKYTNDKRMFDMCSERVKNNYEFIKFMINTFKTDVKFVSSLALNYLNTMDEEDVRYKELIVLVSNLKSNSDDLLKLKLKREIFKTVDLGRMELTIEEELDPNVKRELGMGFIFVIDNYGSSDILKKYFAEEFISRIFHPEDITLEELIHKTVKNFKQIENQGINSFLINFIGQYDSFLATHVSSHLELLDEVKKEIVIIGNNWDKYIERINKRRFDIISQEVYKYIDENSLTLRFSICELLMYVMKKNNLENIYKQYDKTQQYLIENNIQIDDGFIDENKMYLSELRILKYTNDLVVELFKKDVINKEPKMKSENKINTHSKILKYNVSSK